MNFTNLDVKSHYSLLKSTLKIDDIINHAIENKASHVSLCDEVFLGGALEFISKAKKNNLIPIVGLDFYVKNEEKDYHLLAFAKNDKGFYNLREISSYLLCENKNIIEYKKFLENSENLIIVIDLSKNFLYQNYLLNDVLDEEEIVNLQQLFNTPYYFFSFDHDEYKKIIFKNYPNLKVIASKPSYVKEKREDRLHYLLNCIAENKEADAFEMNNHSIGSLVAFNNIPSYYTKEEIINLNQLMSEIGTINLIKKDTLPLYKNDGEKTVEYLRNLATKGLLKRFNGKVANEYFDRLTYELSVIEKMGYSNYFLIVYDYVLFAKKNDILVGPGRGSSAGSLVAYCLGITDVDPIENDLLFERFLNPERLSLPDIDVDFQDDRRDEIIAYLKEKYGENQVAHIITFGTFQAKNSIRDLGRVLKIPNYRLDLILKLIPNVLNIRLETLLEESKQLQVLLQSNDDLSDLYALARRLEGINRHYSTHAAGIIISDSNLIKYAPVLPGLNDTLMIQYNMDYLEDIGIYKMDILGLKNLSILKEILNLLDNKLKINEIPLNDKKTLNMMSQGSTLGIFQFESAGVIKVLRKMKIDSIDDMVATTALFRPGPMQFIDEYIKRKQGLIKYDYIHEDLKPILKNTYGIMVYQEQIMQIVQVMAGFSLAKADIIRKGMAKKDEKLLIDIKKDFITNAQKRGYSLAIATKVYDRILMFSNYGFNKAHAYSYALLGYYLAYLKANYPKEFYLCMLSANIYSISKLKQYLYDMRKLGFNIINPKINYSKQGFVYQDGEFILPLQSIKGIGEANALAIIEERDKNGKYKDYFDAVSRLLKIKFKDGLLKSLIYSGAFDEFEYSRTTMIENLEKIIEYFQIIKDQDNQTFLELDFLNKPKIIKYSENHNVSEKEFELLGLYLTNHPLNIYQDEYYDNILDRITNDHDALVIVDSIKEIRTKKGELMSFINVSDQMISKTLVVFPKEYRKYKGKLKVKDIILINGETDKKDSSNIILKQLRKVS